MLWTRGSAMLSCALRQACLVTSQCISMWEIVSWSFQHRGHRALVAPCRFTIVAVGYVVPLHWRRFCISACCVTLSLCRTAPSTSCPSPVRVHMTLPGVAPLRSRALVWRPAASHGCVVALLGHQCMLIVSSVWMSYILN
eukprot:2860546-Rhodomonas_salina.1